MLEERVINIMPDDKFIDNYIRMSETYCPSKSIYIIWSRNSPLNFVKSEHPKIIHINNDLGRLAELFENLEKKSKLIFHSFDNKFLPLLVKLNPEICKIWIFWGNEGYSAFPSNSFMDRSSHRYIYDFTIGGWLKFLRSRIKNSFLTKKARTNRKFIKEMNYCASWVEEDFRIAKNINKNLKYLPFNYFRKDLMNFNILEPTHIDLSMLFLGNSGAPSNNHVEALNYLKSICFNGKIFCPLSYGGSKKYVQNICFLGRKLFGENFIPLLDFMNLNEYQKILNSCGIIWMNHKRQQAAGNLFTAFYSGKVVITNPVNPMNKTFSNWGLTFYDKGVLNNFMNLTNHEINKVIIEKKIGSNFNFEYFNFVFD